MEGRRNTGHVSWTGTDAVGVFADVGRVHDSLRYEQGVLSGAHRYCLHVFLLSLQSSFPLARDLGYADTTF
jgi:hypothetical protein